MHREQVGSWDTCDFSEQLAVQTGTCNLQVHRLIVSTVRLVTRVGGLSMSMRPRSVVDYERSIIHMSGAYGTAQNHTV